MAGTAAGGWPVWLELEVLLLDEESGLKWMGGGVILPLGIGTEGTYPGGTGLKVRGVS